MTNASQDARIGRPARISREAIAEAALLVGLDQVTVQKVAAALGVDHSSLYRHVRGKDDILMAAADLAVARLDWRVESDDWRLFLRYAAGAMWALYQKHPGLAETMSSLDETPPSGVLAFAETVRRLEAYGFSTADAALVVDSIMDMTADTASAWHRMRRRERKGRSGDQVMRDSWRQHAERNADFAPQIAEMSQVLAGDPHAWWSRKLDLLLDGAAALLARAQAR